MTASAFESEKWIVSYRARDEARIEAAGSMSDMELIADRRRVFFADRGFLAEKFDQSAWPGQNWSEIKSATDVRIAERKI